MPNSYCCKDEPLQRILRSSSRPGLGSQLVKSDVWIYPLIVNSVLLLLLLDTKRSVCRPFYYTTSHVCVRIPIGSWSGN